MPLNFVHTYVRRMYIDIVWCIRLHYACTKSYMAYVHISYCNVYVLSENYQIISLALKLKSVLPHLGTHRMEDDSLPDVGEDKILVGDNS